MKTPALWTALALALLLALPATGYADDEKHLDLTYHQTPVRKAITDIANKAKANVIMHPDVKGEVTLMLRGVPWRDALDAVAKATGNVVKEEDFGILRVLPGKKRAGDPLASMMAERSVKELAAARLRMAELEAKLARARADGNAGRADVQRIEDELARLRPGLDRARRALEEAAALRARVAERKLAKPSKQTVTVYDVADLGKGPKAVERIAGELKRHGLKVERNGNQLIIVTTPEGHKRVQALLESKRRDQPYNVGKPYVTTKKESVRYRVKLGPDGKVLKREKVYETPIDKLPLPGNIEGMKQRKRIADLTAAMKLLESAGDMEGAARLKKHIVEAKAKYAELARRKAEADRLRSARTYHGPYQKDGDLRGAVKALHADVRALRGEVRELSSLVKRLLEQRRR